MSNEQDFSMYNTPMIVKGNPFLALFIGKYLADHMVANTGRVLHDVDIQICVKAEEADKAERVVRQLLKGGAEKNFTKAMAQDFATGHDRLN